MKVTRKETPPAFEPIVIVIETEQEAIQLWHILNCGTGESMKDYIKDNSLDFNIGLKDGMWDTLDGEFTPEDC